MSRTKMEARKGNETAGPFFTIVKALLFMYVITFLLLAVLAMVLYKLEPPELVLQIWILAVYIASGLAGGFYLGRKRKNQKYLWGLVGGGLYFGLLLAVSLILHRGMDGSVTELLTTAILCLASGVIGGMLG